MSSKSLLESSNHVKVNVGMKKITPWDEGGCKEGSCDDKCTLGGCHHWRYPYRCSCPGGGFYCTMSSHDMKEMEMILDSDLTLDDAELENDPR